MLFWYSIVLWGFCYCDACLISRRWRTPGVHRRGRRRGDCSGRARRHEHHLSIFMAFFSRRSTLQPEKNEIPRKLDTLYLNVSNSRRSPTADGRPYMQMPPTGCLNTHSAPSPDSVGGGRKIIRKATGLKTTHPSLHIPTLWPVRSRLATKNSIPLNYVLL